jgi:hypothetical protein
MENGRNSIFQAGAAQKWDEFLEVQGELSIGIVRRLIAPIMGGAKNTAKAMLRST